MVTAFSLRSYWYNSECCNFKQFELQGSNDTTTGKDSEWNTIGTFNDTQDAGGKTHYFHPEINRKYKAFRVKKISSYQNLVIIHEFSLYGK